MSALSTDAWSTIMQFLDVISCENTVEAFGPAAEEAFTQTVFSVLVRQTLRTHLFTSKTQTRAFVQECRARKRGFTVLDALMKELTIEALN